MPRSFAHAPRFEYEFAQDETFVCEFVEAQNGGVMVEYRISGKVAFPERKGPQPKAGDIWQCKIAGQNPAQSVYFVTCLKFISSTASRQAEREAQAAAEKAKEDAWKAQWGSDEVKFEKAWPEIQKVLPEILSKPVAAEVELPGGVKLELQSESLQAATVDPQKGATVTLKQYVKLSLGTYFRQYVEACVYDKLVGWDDVVFSDMYVKPKLATKTVLVTVYVGYGDSSSRKEVGIEFSATSKPAYRESEKLERGERLSIKQDIVFETPLGEMKKTLLLFEYPDRGFSKGMSWTEDAVVLIETVKAEIKAADEAQTQKANANQNVKWLAINYWVWEALRRLGVPGLASFKLPPSRSSYEDDLDRAMVFENDHFIDPALVELVKMIQPREGYSSEKIEAVPWKYHEQVFDVTGKIKEKYVSVIERRWTMMVFPNGPFDAEKLAAILSKTKKVVKPLRNEQFDALMEARKDQKMAVRIFWRDQGKPTTNFGSQYVFSAAFKLPHVVDTLVDHEVESLIIRLKQETEDSESFVKDIAFGNEPFEGVVELQPYLHRSKRGPAYWTFDWTPPLTVEEQSKKDNEALVRLAWYLNEGDARISGYRYSDNENPIILVKSEQGFYTLNELLRDEMRVDYRKGPGSKSCMVRSILANEIRRALEDDYRDHFGWKVVRDPKLPMGKRLKDFLAE